jgi:Leu/Phe-tRNA-protein transferase
MAGVIQYFVRKESMKSFGAVEKSVTRVIENNQFDISVNQKDRQKCVRGRKVTKRGTISWVYLRCVEIYHLAIKCND